MRSYFANTCTCFLNIRFKAIYYWCLSILGNFLHIAQGLESLVFHITSFAFIFMLIVLAHLLDPCALICGTISYFLFMLWMVFQNFIVSLCQYAQYFLIFIYAICFSLHLILNTFLARTGILIVYILSYIAAYFTFFCI